jgi:hypothetical protein
LAEGMTLDELWVKFNAKFENIESGLQAMQVQGKRTDAVWQGIGRTVKTVFSFFALSKIIQVGKALLKMGADTEASQRRAAASIKAVGLSADGLMPKISAYAERMMELGFDDDAVVASMGRLINVTKDYDKALAINAVALDYARYKGVDLNTATLDLIRAYNGQTRAVKEMGIPLRQGAKGMEAVGAIAGKVAGQADAYSKSISGMLEALREKTLNIGESVGIALFPAVNKIMQVMSNLATTLSPLFVQFAGVLSDVLTQLEPLLAALGQGLVDVLQGSAPLIDITVGFLGELGRILTPLVPLMAQWIKDTLIKLAPIFYLIADAVLQILAALVPLIPHFLQLITLATDNEAIFTALGMALTIVANAITGVSILITGAIALFQGLIDAADGVVKAFKAQFNALWTIVRAFVTAMAKTLLGLGDIIAGVFTLDFDRIKRGKESLGAALKEFGGEWRKAINESISNNLGKALVKGVTDAAGKAIDAMLDAYESALAGRGLKLPSVTAPAGTPGGAGGGGTETGVETGGSSSSAFEEWMAYFEHRVAMGELTLEQQIEELENAKKLLSTIEDETERREAAWAIEERIYELKKQHEEELLELRNEQMAQAAELAEAEAAAFREMQEARSSFLQDWIKSGFDMEMIWDRVMGRILDRFIDTLMEMSAQSKAAGLFDALFDLLGLGGGLPSAGGSTALTFSAFERGGIVPKVAFAARGMITPKRGIMPAILHPEEMVLPAHISKAVQRMAERGGGGDQYQVTIHANDARSFAQMLSNPANESVLINLNHRIKRRHGGG